MAKSRKRFDWRVGCTFGSVSSGKKKARIGCHIPDRVPDSKSGAILEHPLLWDNFVLKQLKVSLEMDPNGAEDAPGQGKLVEDAVLAVDGIAEIVGFAAKRDGIGICLSFTKGTVDLSTLDRFAGMPGTLCWSVKGDVQRAVAAQEEEEEDESSAPPPED